MILRNWALLLDGVGRINHSGTSGGNAKKGITRSQALRHAARIVGDFCPQAYGEGIKLSLGCLGARGGIDRPNGCGKRRGPSTSRNPGCCGSDAMQVCSVVAGKTAARASGMPFKPSVTAIGYRPRLGSSDH